MANYLFGSGTVSEKLATVSLRDWIGDGGMEVIGVIPDDAADWVGPVVSSLGLTTTPFIPDFSSTDTVIAPADAEGLEDILRTGAVVLDLSDGLVPLELVEDEPVADVPDIPEGLAEPEVDTTAPTLEAPRPARTKPTLPPTADAAPPAEKKKRAPRKSAALKKAEVAAAEAAIAAAAESDAEVDAETQTDEERSQPAVEVDSEHAEDAVIRAAQALSAGITLSTENIATATLSPHTPSQDRLFLLHSLILNLLEGATEETLWNVLNSLRP